MRKATRSSTVRQSVGRGHWEMFYEGGREMTFLRLRAVYRLDSRVAPFLCHFPPVVLCPLYYSEEYSQ